ncbi:hypothetical protein BGX29_010592 [Mortierella sp. GBA35]|nr:hypothetical protein BGX29_010592 [Mortierella sp. GBA35]
MMENGPARRWSCYKSLKRLDIRRLGVVELDLDHWDNTTRIERNRKAFRKIQKRIRMLPNLKELTVSVFGADEELIQGFLGIEDQDKEESEGARSSEVTEDADEIFGCKRSRVGTRAAAAALAAPHRNQRLTHRDFLDVIYGFCPELTHLNMESCHSIPASTYSRFFAASSLLEHRGLGMKYPRLNDCMLDDQSLEKLAWSQAETRGSLTLRKCSRVTDSGITTILSHCHRLASLSLLQNSTVTVGVMMEEGPAYRWSCYKSLKRLEIRVLGVVRLPLPHAEDDPRVEQNRESFRRIRKRVRMLTTLRELCVSVYGTDEELVRGFWGLRIWKQMGGTQGAMTLVGPRLQTLRIRGLLYNGLSSQDIDQFLRNSSGLKVVDTYETSVHFGEIGDSFLEAGIRLIL